MNKNLKNDIEKAIERDLPGWKLLEPGEYEKSQENIEFKPKEPSFEIEELRQKFLSKSVKPQNTERKIVTITVQPISGGPGKVADYKNGKAIIVQG